MELYSFVQVVLIIGAAQGFFLSIILLTTRRGNRKANRVIGIVIFLFSIMILPHSKVPGHSNEQENLWGQYFIHMIFFLIPPLIFFYISLLTSVRSVIKRNDLFHLLPFSLLLIIFIILKIFETGDEVWRTAGIAMTLLIVAQFPVYLFFSLKMLRTHRENIRYSYSYLEKINLNWLRFLITGQMIVWPLLLIIEIFRIEPHQLMWIPLALFIYLMGYFSITQPEIISGEIIPERKTDKASGKKYAKSSLTPEMADNYYCRLIKLLEEEKPYLKNDLTLQSLASSLSISTHFLSQVINEKFNQNFYDLINNYRIEEAKKLLLDPQKNHLSIAAVGFEAGFNSVSSFNSFFKKIMKITPSEFRKSRVER